jgi:hypothetical protein
MKPKKFIPNPFPPAKQEQVVSFGDVARERKYGVEGVDAAVEYSMWSHEGSKQAEATIAHHINTITSRAVEFEDLKRGIAPVIPINRAVELEAPAITQIPQNVEQQISTPSENALDAARRLTDAAFFEDEAA